MTSPVTVLSSVTVSTINVGGVTSSAYVDGVGVTSSTVGGVGVDVIESRRRRRRKVAHVRLSTAVLILLEFTGESNDFWR